MGNLAFIFIITIFLFFFEYSYAADTITISQSVTDYSNQTLASKDGTFELGFFSPGTSRKRFIGIWYKVDPTTVVWVANRQNPINGSSGILLISNITGNLVLVSDSKDVVWSSNLTITAKNPTVQLLDSGNLVIKDEEARTYFWQSFDYPTDTYLPGMKIGWDSKSGLNRRLSAWKNPVDPSPGDFTYGIELCDYPHFTMWKGSQKYYRNGPWNGYASSGLAPVKDIEMYEAIFVSNKEEVYFIFNLKTKLSLLRTVLNQTLYSFQYYAWNPPTKSWEMYFSEPNDNCDQYSLCGSYGNCIITKSPVCQCLEGFKPKSPENWTSAVWSQGCVRNNPLNCQNGDGFVKFSGLKLPDAEHSWVNTSMNLQDCRGKCLNNCSCMAYTNSDIRNGGSGCAIWLGELYDMRQSVFGQDLYVRMSASDSDANLPPQKERRSKSKVKMMVIIGTITAICFGLLILGCYIHKSKSRLREHDEEDDLELPLIDLTTIANATNNFSTDNKLGEGGFGPVYKGILMDGKEIAVKRLSKSSGQGLEEFKNEVILIAKLQHRNLVKLLGCCIQGVEKMLIYEYMPNKSLDTFIFDETRSKMLDWSRRFSIIGGIARGLLYLHQDSRLRIIHRDLKSSNVLLDKDMNPKISDFGMAKTFGGDQTEGNTSRVVGTYGYMAPEYALDGLFSVKSDVFSFGVLLVEIISGKKSRGLYNLNRGLNLIGHAWNLWNEGKPLELVDPIIEEGCNTSEVNRCIQISLLCVQQHPEERPSMASVVMMLGSESPLPQPKQPGFSRDKYPVDSESSSSKVDSSATNGMSISLLVGR